MRHLAIKLVEFLENKKVLNHGSKEVYIYGADIILYTILSTLGLLIIGLACGYFLESALIIFVFYFNQSMGGGYHATTHSKCFLVMFCGLLIALSLLSLSSQWLTLFGIASIAYLFYTPLVINKTRAHLMAKKESLTRKAVTATVLEAFVYVLFLTIGTVMCSAFSLGLVVSAISRFVGKHSSGACYN